MVWSRAEHETCEDMKVWMRASIQIRVLLWEPALGLSDLGSIAPISVIMVNVESGPHLPPNTSVHPLLSRMRWAYTSYVIILFVITPVLQMKKLRLRKVK